MSEQLTLPMSLHDDATFDNFTVGQNKQAVAMLQYMVQHQTSQLVYLWGTQGSGCSHLLQACCSFAHEQGLTSSYLPMKELKQLSVDILEGLDAMPLVCIDDIHVAIEPGWQEGLFHLYNRLMASQGMLVVTANDSPLNLKVPLADLKSRLSAGTTYQLQQLSDDEKIYALISRAQLRGFTLTADAANYLLRHCPRDTGQLFALLAKLDQASLAAKRKLTIPFIKQVLAL